MLATSVLSNSTGMTAQVSPGTCSVRPDPQVHLETVLSLLLLDPPEGLPLTFDGPSVCPDSHIYFIVPLKSKCKFVAAAGKHKAG